MSSLASFLSVVPRGRSSFVMGSSGGSLTTSLQTTSSRLERVSLRWLCRRDVYPPSLHIREWSMEFGLPQAQSELSPSSLMLYRILMLSWNSCLDRMKPQLFRGRDVSQEEAPFSDASAICLPSSSPQVLRMENFFCCSCSAFLIK